MTTELAPSFLDDSSLPLDELPSVTLEPARLNWHHGVDAGKVKMPGVFFGRDTAFTDTPPLPWETDDRFIDDDGPGYSAPRLRIAFLGWREQWFIPGEKKGDKITWLPLGQRSPQGTKIKKNVEYLILVDGLSDPMVLSVSGFYKSKPFEDIMHDYEKGALSQLIRAKKRAFPRWAHWLTIGGKVDAKGTPIIESAKDAKGEEYGSGVTPPTMLATPELVSSDVMRLGIDTWNLYNSLGWFKFQRTNNGTVEGSFTVETVPQLPAGRNVPQPIKEAEIPF